MSDASLLQEPERRQRELLKQLHESTELSAFEMFRNFPAYLSGPTARDYTDTSKFKAAGVRVELKSCEHPEEPQPFGARRTQR